MKKLLPLLDVVLLSPPSRSFNHYRPPVALVYLSGYLKHRGLRSKIIDITENTVIRNHKFDNDRSSLLRRIFNQIISAIKNNPAKIFGITCYTPEYYEVLKLARKIKSIYPHSKIIVGGIHPTLYPRELLQEPNTPIDFEVIGEGEETLFELATAIIKKQPYHHIKGLAYFNLKKQIIITPYRPVKDNLDEISFPDYSDLDMEYYTNASPYSIRGCYLRSFYILATRGCPSNCTFCVANKLRKFNGGGRYTRTRSAISLIGELETLVSSYHIDSFYFIDDLFTISKDNVAEFCRLLKKKPWHLLWGCSSKVSTLDRKTLKLMSQSGCIQIDFGVERGSDYALRLVQKGITIKMISQVFRWCRLYHIRTFANFLVNLPEETEEDLKDIIALTRHLQPDIVSFNVFTPYPGTQIYDQSPYHFNKNEYTDLTYASALIKKYPEKYRFSKHHVDILSWADNQNKIFNKLWPNLKFHLSFRYLRTLLSSTRLDNYLSQFKFLILEYINQKYH